MRGEAYSKEDPLIRKGHTRANTLVEHTDSAFKPKQKVVVAPSDTPEDTSLLSAS